MTWLLFPITRIKTIILDSYEESEMKLSWLGDDPIEIDDALALPEMTLAEVRTRKCRKRYKTGQEAKTEIVCQNIDTMSFRLSLTIEPGGIYISSFDRFVDSVRRYFSLSGSIFHTGAEVRILYSADICALHFDCDIVVGLLLDKH